MQVKKVNSDLAQHVLLAMCPPWFLPNNSVVIPTFLKSRQILFAMYN